MKDLSRRTFARLAFAAVFAVSSGARAQADIRPAAPDGLAQLDDFLKKTSSGRGRFVQRVETKEGERAVADSSGRFVFHRPGRFYWAYEKPYRQTIVADGHRLTLYDEDLQQASVAALDEKIPPSPASLLFGRGALSGDAWTIVRTEPGVVTLKPKDAGTFESVSIRFDERGLPATMSLTDAFGQVTTLDFDEIETGPVDDKVFDFTPPDGVDVIDLTATSDAGS